MWWLLAVLGVVLLGAALWGPIVSNVEQPKYKIAESSGNIEIRDYPPMIVAEAEVIGGAATRQLARAFVSSPITSLGIIPRRRRYR